MHREFEAIKHNEKVISLVDYMSIKKLTFNNAASDLFEYINNLVETKIIIISFRGVDFVSKIFAQEYSKNKKMSEKNIIEINMDVDVKKMFAAATRK